MVSFKNTIFLMITPLLSTSFRFLTRSFIVPKVTTSFFLMMGTTSSSSTTTSGKYPIYGDESIMRQKAHGTCDKPAMRKLRWGVSYETTDRVCCFNRHYAEHSGYFETTRFLEEVDKEGETTYYDPIDGKPLFIAPRGRSFEEFKKESLSHGWPSFRDQEVNYSGVSISLDELFSVFDRWFGTMFAFFQTAKQ